MLIASNNDRCLPIAEFLHMCHRRCVFGQINQIIRKPLCFQRTGCRCALHTSRFGIDGYAHQSLSLFCFAKQKTKDTGRGAHQSAATRTQALRPRSLISCFGRFPGSRLWCGSPPSQCPCTSGFGRSLAAYSCGGSVGIAPDFPFNPRGDSWAPKATSYRCVE